MAIVCVALGAVASPRADVLPELNPGSVTTLVQSRNNTDKTENPTMLSEIPVRNPIEGKSNRKV